MKLGSLIALVTLGTLLSLSCGDDGEDNPAGSGGDGSVASGGGAGEQSSSGTTGEAGGDRSSTAGATGGDRSGTAAAAGEAQAGTSAGGGREPEPVAGGSGGAAQTGEAAGASVAGGEQPTAAGAPSAGGSVGSSGEAGASSGEAGAPSSGEEATLGLPCTADADCGELDCVEADSGALGAGDLGRASPANGLCTMACTSNADCDALEPGALCLGFGGDTSYCVQGCEFGSETLVLFSEDKCHARHDMACSPLFHNTGDACDTDNDCFRGELCAGTCLAIIPTCLPVCADSANCPEDWFCDPASGLCVEEEPSKKLLGDSCDPEAAVDECEGMCLSETNEDGDIVAGRCQELCTIGAGPPACGWDGENGLAAVCSPAFNPDLVGPGAWGDVGLCTQYCNCDSDCLGDSICWAFENGPRTDGAGYCEYPFLPDGTKRLNLPCD